MRPETHRASRRRYRSIRGATLTEYALIIFMVTVAGAVGFRVFGAKISGGVSKAGSGLESSKETARAGSQGGAGSSAASSSGGAAASSTGTEEAATYGGARTATTEKEGTPYAKFAMIALGVVGAAAAFFAAVKGKGSV
jgi:Flp pilus assembly pilin Flp